MLDRIAFGIRRIEHLPYFRILIEEFAKLGVEIDLYVDRNYISETYKNITELERIKPSVFRIIEIESDAKIIDYAKKILGQLIYLSDSIFEKDYFIRHTNKTQLNNLLTWLIYLREMAPRISAQLAKFLILSIRNITYIFSKLNSKIRKSFNYDLLIVSPGNMINSVEDTLLIRARINKVPSIVLALSLDNLNNKGTIIHVPDIYLAWNSHHKRLLRERHLIPENRIRTCGSPYFEMYANLDEINTSASVSSLFPNAKPSRTILYLGSSANVISREDIFLSQLIENSGILDRGYEIIIRPHPANSSIWKNWDLSGTIIFPKDSQLLERDALTTREIMKNVEFCVGVNTSAFLDSIACGIPTFAMRNPNALFQKNASHFNFLLEAGLPIVNSFTEVLYNKKYLDENVSDNRLIREIVLPYFGKVGKRFAEICNEVLVSEGVHNHGR